MSVCIIYFLICFCLCRIQPLSGQISAVTQVYSESYIQPVSTCTPLDLSQAQAAAPGGGQGEGGGGADDPVESVPPNPSQESGSAMIEETPVTITGGMFSGVGEFPPTEKPQSSPRQFSPPPAAPMGGGGEAVVPRTAAPPRLRDLNMRQVKEAALRYKLMWSKLQL